MTEMPLMMRMGMVTRSCAGTSATIGLSGKEPASAVDLAGNITVCQMLGGGLGGGGD